MINDNLIDEFKKVRQDVKLAVDQFPEEKREQCLFDKWSLKDIVAHLSGWDIFTVEAIKGLEKDNVLDWGAGVNEFNKKQVEKRKKWSWKKVYNEFIEVGDKLFKAYEDLSEEYWDKKFWPNKDETPREFLKIDIDHYKNEHLSQIKNIK